MILFNKFIPANVFHSISCFHEKEFIPSGIDKKSAFPDLSCPCDHHCHRRVDCKSHREGEGG